MDERREAAQVFGTPFKSTIPKIQLASLVRDGIELETHYAACLMYWASVSLIGVIFRSTEPIQDLPS